MQTVQAEYGDRVIWFDEHWAYGGLSIPETTERAHWYGLQEYPYVRVDGSRALVGIASCEMWAVWLRGAIEARLGETGGMSPVEIDGKYATSQSQLYLHGCFRLMDPVPLPDVRGTVLIYEESVEHDHEEYPRVTRAIHYEPVVLSAPGDSVVFDLRLDIEAGWDADELRAVLFLQQTGGDKAVIQAAMLPLGEVPASAGEDPRSLAAPLAVHPNPCRGDAEIRFQVQDGGTSSVSLVRLEVLDLAGRRVATLLEGAQSPGGKSATWSGRSDAGEPVPNGVYFVRLETPEGSVRTKLLLLR